MTLTQTPFKTPLFSKRQTLFWITTVSAVALLMVCAPEGWASDTTSKQSLTTQIDDVRTLVAGPGAKFGLTVGVVIGTLTGIVKHSVAIVLTSMGLGIALSYYMNYLNVWGT